MRLIDPIIYKKFKGQRNVDGGHRLDPTKTRSFLGPGTKNIYIDKTGALHRRDGFELQLSGDYSSIWSNGTITMAVKDGDLMKVTLGSTYTESIIKLNMGDGRISYCEIGNRIYLTNNVIIGYIEDEAWNDIPVPTSRYKRAIPAGHLLEIYKSVLFVIRDNWGIYSDAAAHQIYDVRNDPYQFPSRISMWRAVDDGIFISDQTTTIFLSGANAKVLKAKKIADYPAIEGTDSRSRGIFVGGEFYDAAVIWQSTKGICLGTNEGAFINLTEGKYNAPDARIGSGLITRGAVNQYISITRN